MNGEDFENRLRQALRADAEHLRVDPDAWSQVQSRLHADEPKSDGRKVRSPSRRTWIAGTAIATAAAIATVVVMLAPRLADPNVSRDPDIAGPTRTPGTTPATAERTPAIQPAPAPLAQVVIANEVRVEVHWNPPQAVVKAFTWKANRWQPLEGAPAIGPRRTGSGELEAPGICQLRVAGSTVTVRLAEGAKCGSLPYQYLIDQRTITKK